MTRRHRPLFLELAGLPAAGKTTLAGLLKSEVRRLKRNCTVVPEAAAKSPLVELKRDWRFNAWTLCQTVSRILELDQRPAKDLVVLDRGLFDAMCWITWHVKRGTLHTKEAGALCSFARLPCWFRRLDLVIVLRVDFDTALRRRKETGRILNRKTFAELERAYGATLADFVWPKRTRLRFIDTDMLSPSEVLERTVGLLEEMGVNP